jgi:hypothetical protein
VLCTCFLLLSKEKTEERERERMRDQRISVIIISFLTVYFTVFMTKERHYYMIVINVFFAQKSEHLPALEIFFKTLQEIHKTTERKHTPLLREE